MCIRDRHTFSSLTKDFLGQYNGTLTGADVAYVFFNPHALELKKLPPIDPNDVIQGFGDPHPAVFTDANNLVDVLLQHNWGNSNLLIMTSGNLAGTDLQHLADEVVKH